MCIRKRTSRPLFMKYVRVRNLSRSLPHPLQVRYCDSFLCRLRGLTFRRSLPPGEGLLLVQDQESHLNAAIHMLFVGMNLAVVWLNGHNQVVDVQLARSWRPFYLPARPACSILEMAPSRLPHFHVGDQIDFEEISLE